MALWHFSEGKLGFCFWTKKNAVKKDGPSSNVMQSMIDQKWVNEGNLVKYFGCVVDRS